LGSARSSLKTVHWTALFAFAVLGQNASHPPHPALRAALSHGGEREKIVFSLVGKGANAGERVLVGLARRLKMA